MVIDIASLDLKERPVLALENLDETPIAILGNAFNIEAHIAYNDTSSITFDLPAYANGVRTQGYDDVIGTRLIRLAGWGVFILVNPETTGDGVSEIKSCKAYSREYEFTYKKMSLEENTYNLWNPVTPDSTILGIVLSYVPYWSVGTVDSDLIGKYRTFSENNVNIYNFLKSTVQTKYGCIVDFDTVNRQVNLRSTANHAATQPVYLSLNNLAKEIEREEDTENIFTCLDVNGADGVTIRSVNPTGTNKIYNLDYYMYSQNEEEAYGSDIWWAKSISSSRGTTSDSTTRISTKEYIDKSVRAIRPKSGYDFCVFGWNQAGTYMGVWNGSSWTKTGGATWFSTEIKTESLSGNYDVKLVARKSSNAAISPSEGVNIVFIMNTYKTGHFSQEFVDKWTAWKEAFDAAQDEYYLLTIERMLKTSEIVFAQSEIDDTLNAKLKALEAQQSVYIELLARSDPSSDAYRRADIMLNGGTWQGQYYSGINNDIADKETAIAAQRTRVTVLEAEKAVLTTALQTINRRLAFETIPSEDSPTDDPDDPSFIPLFTASEILLLKQYFKEDSISDSSFVYAEAKNYEGNDETVALTSSSPFSVSGSSYETTTTGGGHTIVKCSGGSVSIGTLTASLIKATAEYDPTAHHIVFTAYLSAGLIGTTAFPGGCLTAVTDGGTFTEGVSSLSFTSGTGRMYFTRNTTEYEKYAVEWDLYEYGRQCLEKLAYPSYSFSLDAANFLSLDAFQAFKNELTLGDKVYIDMDDGSVLTPIFIGFEYNFEDPSSFKMEFGDKYCLKDAAFELADLLNQSVSMGKTVDVSKFGYNAFIDSGASTAVKDYMDAALDVSKQAILSSGNIAITWDESGLKLRKWTNANHTAYEPEQIAMINNNIVFTDDAWESAKMAIGHFKDKLDIAKDAEEPGVDHESWGIVAPNIVGTLLAGENLVIESKKQDGGVAVFKVDADGAVLHNSKFDIVRSNTVAPGATQTYTHILLDPDLGFGLGAYPVVNSGAWDTTNAKFWVDMTGNVRLNNSYIDLRRNNTGGGQTQIIIDPELGFGIGTNSIVTTSGGSRQWNTTNTKLWIDTTGNLHIKGTLDAADGTFSGSLSAATGTFNGIVRASDFQYYDGSGYVSMLTTEGSINKFKSDYLSLKGIEVRDSSETVTFKVDSSGNVTVNGNITMGSGTSIDWGSISQTNGTATLNADFANSSTVAGQVADDANTALSNASTAISTANDASSTATAAKTVAALIADGLYTGTTIDGVTYTGTFINGQSIFSPTIYANEFIAKPLATSYVYDNVGGFLLQGYYGGSLQNVFRVHFYGGDSPVTYIETYGDLSLPNGVRLSSSSVGTGGYISGGTSSTLSAYATLQGYFKVSGVLNTGGGGNSYGFLVVNNGTAEPGTYFSDRAVPAGTVYFKWDS